MAKTYGENGLEMPFLSISPLIGRFKLFWLFYFVFLYFGHLAVVVLKFFYKVRKMGNEKIFYVFKNHQNRMKIERARRFFHFWPPGCHFFARPSWPRPRGRPRSASKSFIYTSSRNPHLQHVPEAALRPQDDLGTASKNGLKRPQMTSSVLKRPLMVLKKRKSSFFQQFEKKSRKNQNPEYWQFSKFYWTHT